MTLGTNGDWPSPSPGSGGGDPDDEEDFKVDVIDPIHDLVGIAQAVLAGRTGMVREAVGTNGKAKREGEGLPKQEW